MKYPVKAAPTIRQLHELSVWGCTNFPGGAARTIRGGLHQLSGGGLREKCSFRGLRVKILKEKKTYLKSAKNFGLYKGNMLLGETAL